MMLTRCLVLILFLATAHDVFAQDDNVGPEKIGPGEYHRIRNGIVLSRFETLQIKAGDSRQFRILTSIGSGMVEVAAPTEWSVTPAEGVALGKDGLLRVAPYVKPGTRFTVTAKVFVKESWEDSGESYDAEKIVVVYDPQQSPLVGEWRQISETHCSGKNYKVDGRVGLGSLVFNADGSFSASRRPDSSRRDYWGTYRIDLNRATLRLTVDGGNEDITLLKTDGRFVVTKGTLTITGMQLYPDYKPPKRCKLEFARL